MVQELDSRGAWSAKVVEKGRGKYESSPPEKKKVGTTLEKDVVHLGPCCFLLPQPLFRLSQLTFPTWIEEEVNLRKVWSHFFELLNPRVYKKIMVALLLGQNPLQV